MISRALYPIGLVPIAVAAGASTPAANITGSLAWSTTLGCAVVWDGAAWRIQQLQTVPITVSVATYTVAPTDSALIFSAACTVTLPAPATFPGRVLTLKTILAIAVSSASANVRPIASATAGTPILTAAAGKYAQLVSDGTAWVTMISN